MPVHGEGHTTIMWIGTTANVWQTKAGRRTIRTSNWVSNA